MFGFRKKIEPKPIAQMTSKELQAYVDELFHRRAVKFAEQMLDDETGMLARIRNERSSTSHRHRLASLDVDN